MHLFPTGMIITQPTYLLPVSTEPLMQDMTPLQPFQTRRQRSQPSEIYTHKSYYAVKHLLLNSHSNLFYCLLPTEQQYMK
jgi:hypothetical protein